MGAYAEPLLSPMGDKRSSSAVGTDATERPRHLRMSHQRRVILDELRGTCMHPSAEEVHEWVRARLPRISLGTVYRNLEILAELGEIRKLEFGGTVMRFDGRLEHHYHIRCTCCDRVDDAPLAPRIDIDHELLGETAYKVIGHHLEFIGLCPSCAREMIAPGFARLRIRAQRNAPPSLRDLAEPAPPQAQEQTRLGPGLNSRPIDPATTPSTRR